ncbi:MAG: homoserine kinase [Actinobacteria bacterium]|nr:MAG: homoserine kinase [Actinomycetota bacterium]
MPVVVQAPATSANLGPGFDCLGLALELRDHVTFTEAQATSVTVDGEGAGELSLGPDHLVLSSFRAAFDECGLPVPEVAVHCRNNIPHGRGLGSSSAAIVTGLVGARAMGAGLDDAALLALATRIEGHPDNVAPALLGGLTVSWMSEGVGRAVRLDPAPGLEAVVAIPLDRLSTATARTLLPATVPFGDAVHALGRAALAVAAFSAHPEHLLDATDDRIHQDYRKSAYPQSWDLVQQWRAAGVPAAISGAGPTVIAFASGVEVPDGWRREELRIADQGATVGKV